MSCLHVAERRRADYEEIDNNINSLLALDITVCEHTIQNNKNTVICANKVPVQKTTTSNK